MTLTWYVTFAMDMDMMSMVLMVFMIRKVLYRNQLPRLDSGKGFQDFHLGECSENN